MKVAVAVVSMTFATSAAACAVAGVYALAGIGWALLAAATVFGLAAEFLRSMVRRG